MPPVSMVFITEFVGIPSTAGSMMSSSLFFLLLLHWSRTGEGIQKLEAFCHGGQPGEAAPEVYYGVKMKQCHVCTFKPLGGLVQFCPGSSKPLDNPPHQIKGFLMPELASQSDQEQNKILASIPLSHLYLSTNYKQSTWAQAQIRCDVKL